MASPIQVVLNPENFNGDRRKGGGGESTDFYADRDEEFRAHKKKIKNRYLLHHLQHQRHLLTMKNLPKK